MARIRQRGDKWQVEVYLGLDPITGSKVHKTATFDTQKECRKWASEKESDKYNKRITAIGEMTFREWSEIFLRDKKPTIKVSTYLNYVASAKDMMPYFGKMKLSSITDLHIERYKAEKLSRLSSTTVRKHLLFLNLMLKKALKNASPMYGVDLPKVAKYTPTVPTDEQFALMVADAKLKKDQIIMLIAGKLGCRLGEIFALKWDDIDFKKKTIRVDQSMNLNEDYQFELGEPKSRKGYRTIPCSDDILEKLLDYRANPYKSKRGTVHKNVVEFDGRIFPSSPRFYSYNFAKRMDKLGMPDIRFHDLRHYCATWMYKHKIPDQVAADMLGHDIWVLKSIYQHLGLSDNEEEMDKIRAIQNTILANS